MDLKAIRAEYPILRRTVYERPLVYLDNSATTQLPLCVEDAILRYYREKHANVYRGAHYLGELATAQVEEVRQETASFLGANPDEIIFTSGTTSGLNLLTRSIGESLIQAGDRVLVTAMEHHSNFLPWQELCARCQAELSIVPITPTGELDITILQKMLKHPTKVLAVTAVSNVLGTCNPLPEIISAAHNAGALVIVDGAQSVRHGVTNVCALNCDAFAFSGHKMMAPTGTGVLYIRRSLQTLLRPAIFGGGMVDKVGDLYTTYASGPAKFEAGTPNIAGIVGIGAAIRYLTGLGLSTIASRETSLLQQAEDGLRAIPGVHIFGNPAHRIGSLSFSLDKVHHFDTAALLDRLGIAVRAGHHCAQPLMRQLGVTGTVRVSPAFYNSEEEINAFLSAIDRVRKVVNNHYG